MVAAIVAARSVAARSVAVVAAAFVPRMLAAAFVPGMPAVGLVLVGSSLPVAASFVLAIALVLAAGL